MADPYYITALKSGYKWSDQSLYFSFFSVLPSYYGPGADEANGFRAFTADMQDAARDILAQISTFADITFTETVDASLAQIGFGQTSLASYEIAYAYFPESGEGAKNGDVWVNKTDPEAHETDPGEYGYWVLLHEIGHALGLRHSFATSLLPTAEENTRYTVMSYETPVMPESYMLYDIAALQSLYGANMTYHTGDDVYRIGAGQTLTIWDAGGNDTLDVSAVNASMTWRLAAGTVHSIGTADAVAIAFGVTIENILAGDGHDTIYGNDGDNYIHAGGGNDTVYGQGGVDTVDGGTGNDKLVFSTAFSLYTFAYIDSETIALLQNMVEVGRAIGVETLEFAGVQYSLSSLLAPIDPKLVFGGTPGDDTVAGTIGEDTLHGADGNDTLSGGYEEDLLYGDNGNDALQGENGADTVYGGDGDDALSGGAGGDDLYGDAGDDDLYGDGGDDTIEGGDGSDYLYGGDGGDRLYGGDGNDVLTGGDERDFLEGDAGDDYILGGTENDYILGDGGDDTLEGESGNDYLKGGDGSDILRGGDGDDSFEAGKNDDTIEGGAGEDSVTYYLDLVDFAVTFVDATTIVLTDLAADGEGTDRLTDIEFYWFDYTRYTRAQLETAVLGAQTLSGTKGKDTLSGGAFNDVIYGLGGNDTLRGHDGGDNLSGGDGDDTLEGEASRDKLQGGAGNDKLYGGEGDDSLLGEAGNDTLQGDSGNDMLWGGDGNDILYGFSGRDTLDGGAGNDKLFSHQGEGTLYGGDGNDSLSGSDGDDVLWGGLGGDKMTGSSGGDEMRGDEGNDAISGDSGNDAIWGGAGDDTLNGGDGDDLLEGGDGKDSLSGMSGNDTLQGGSGNDVLMAAPGNDKLYGGAGKDVMIGGLGADTFIFDTLPAKGNEDTITDFSFSTVDIVNFPPDKLDISALLTGYDPLTDALSDFVDLTVKGKNTTLSVDIDGALNGRSFVTVATLQKAVFTDESAMVAAGLLVVS